MKIKRSEDNLQSIIWKRLWNNYPELRRCIWHVPNQGSSMKEGVRLKAMGVLAGVWDLHLFYKGEFHIWELKSKTGKLSRSRIGNKGKLCFGQFEWGELMALHGAYRHVCRTEQEFFTELDELLNRLNLQH
jgi:hypothetical protein